MTTAFGLLVAIPAVMAYNYLQGWVDARAVDISESSNELLDVVARRLDASGDARAAGGGVARGALRRGRAARPAPVRSAGIALTVKDQVFHGNDQAAKEGVKNEINVTPLVDVVLVLLIIFMVVTPMLQRGKDVRAAAGRATSTRRRRTADPIILSVTTDKKMWIESEPFRGRGLEAELAASSRSRAGQRRSCSRATTRSRRRRAQGDGRRPQGGRQGRRARRRGDEEVDARRRRRTIS